MTPAARQVSCRVPSSCNPVPIHLSHFLFFTSHGTKSRGAEADARRQGRQHRVTVMATSASSRRRHSEAAGRWPAAPGQTEDSATASLQLHFFTQLAGLKDGPVWFI